MNRLLIPTQRISRLISKTRHYKKTVSSISIQNLSANIKNLQNEIDLMDKYLDKINNCPQRIDPFKIKFSNIRMKLISKEVMKEITKVEQVIEQINGKDKEEIGFALVNVSAIVIAMFLLGMS